ncbi:MAG: class I SAM-dependent methyltransferase [Planctomycetota bacterium]|nr:class I SAM-dependent methyltransferase [Planctomycetota bacterium]
MSNYYDGLNQKLLDAVPKTARRVLELGCANGRLGRRFKAAHPEVQWYGVELSADAAKVAAQYLDRVFVLDLDRADLSVLEGGFDVIVIGDLLEHLTNPERVLEALYDLAAAQAQIVCCLPNMGHLSVIERLVAGDISYDAMGLLDATHLRFYSPSSAFKTFLDAGWLPHMQDQYRVEVPKTPFATCIVNAAEALGLPATTAMRNLGLYQMILVCQKWSMDALRRTGPSAAFSVIVPVNRPWQYELNVARSPGLREVNAEVICVQGAESAAAAFATGASRANHAWRIMVHQDVYFPTGSGLTLAKQLGSLERIGMTAVPVGFAGVESAGPNTVRYAGMVVDRTNLFLHGVSSCAASIDEFAVAMHRDCAAHIDATLGWHLWATDLCLQARHREGCDVAQILAVPLFHNSTTANALPDAFHLSAQRLLEKHPNLYRIPTLCGEITRPASAVV